MGGWTAGGKHFVGFTIKRHHAEAFQSAAQGNFERAAVAHLREKLSAQVSGESDHVLTLRVRDATARAKDFGLVTQQQVMCFLDSEVLLGKKFYERGEHLWASQLLHSDKVISDDKAGLLLATASSFFREKPGAQG